MKMRPGETLAFILFVIPTYKVRIEKNKFKINAKTTLQAITRMIL